jgi:mono/diheme cytochrome c family protein
MGSHMKPSVFFVAIVALASGAVLMGRQQPAAGPFTAEQATAGRTAYDTNCASCHGADLSGGGVPALAGSPFLGSWGSKTTRDLPGLVQTTMPPDKPGGLPEQTYLNIVSYIMQANGSPAGTQPLTPTTSVSIGATAKGAPQAAQAAAGLGAGAAGAAAGCAAISSHRATARSRRSRATTRRSCSCSGSRQWPKAAPTSRRRSRTTASSI